MITTKKKPEPTATTKTTTKKKKIDVTVTPEQHVEAVKSFIHSCLKVRYFKAGLPKSKQASDAAVEQVAKDAEGDEAAFTVGKRLLSCDHPLIDAINAWSRAVDKWRNTFTFSMASDDSVDADTLKKARGERLIRIADVDDFEKGMVAYEKEGLTISAKLCQQYEQILALEKKRLGKEFNASDYPSADKIWWEEPREVTDETTGKIKTITVENGILRIGRRAYAEVPASVHLPKAVFQRMQTQAAELMNQTLEVAVIDVTSIISKTFLDLSKQLVDRTRIRPPNGHPLRKQIGAQAEVMSTREEGGKKFLTLKWAGEGRAKHTDEFGPYTDEEYEALRPEAMTETKSLHKSVIERLGEHLEVFSDLKSKLGMYGEHVDDILDAVRNLYHKGTGKGDKKAENMVSEIKNSSFFRTTLMETLEGATAAMAEVATEAKKVRRKVHANISAQAAKMMSTAKKESAQ